MCDQWMTRQELPLTQDQVARLPRSPAWQYSALDGRLILWPRVRAYHAVLALDGVKPASEHVFTAVPTCQHAELEATFKAAFRSVIPYAGLDDATLAEAAHVSLGRTWSGMDGPLVQPACCAAREQERIQGALFVTLLPPGSNLDPASWYWQEPAPARWEDAIGGRPHLTWVFVDPACGRSGLATAMLRHAAAALRERGFSFLLSTFLLGNDASLLWHWKNGFELLPTRLHDQTLS